MGLREYKTKEQQQAFYLSNEWRGKNGMRQQALERDNHECVWCREAGYVTTDAILEVDHIEPIDKRPDLALELSNTRTLCKSCHNKRHNRFEHRKNKWEGDERW